MTALNHAEKFKIAVDAFNKQKVTEITSAIRQNEDTPWSIAMFVLHELNVEYKPVFVQYYLDISPEQVRENFLSFFSKPENAKRRLN